MKFKCNIYAATVYQLLIPLLLLWLTRFGFYAYNADVTGHLAGAELLGVAAKGFIFDIVAVAYFNSLFILMRFLPFGFVMKRWWQRLSMAVYAITNSLMLTINIGDIPYFRFNNGRMQRDVFLQMFDPEMMATAFFYVRQYWWAYVAVFMVIAAMLWLATRVKVSRQAFRPWPRIGLFVAAIVATFFAMRGCSFSAKPIGIDSAAAMGRRPEQINVMLNSPFCVVRASGSTRGMETMQFYSEAELRALRSSVHGNEPADTFRAVAAGKNIVLIILEGGGQIWLDSISPFKAVRYAGNMPFLDSLATKSLALTSTYCTGARTIEGLASIIGGVPTFGQLNWMAAKYATYQVDAPARLLRAEGYDTRFFIGAPKDLFSLGPLASTMGFASITGRDEIALPKTGNTNSWGYFDHVMAGYVANEMTQLHQPFFAAWLTVDFHGPYTNIPADFPAAESDIIRCAKYTDFAVRTFFEAAQKQPWYDNTVFIITADHGFRDFPEEELNGTYVYAHIPFIIYTPDGSIAPARRGDRPMAQFDIPPTLLWLAGYDKPYVGVGTNYFDDTKPHYGLTVRFDTWFVASSRYVLNVSFDCNNILGVYDITVDPLMQHPLVDYDSAEVGSMLTWLKAFWQDYTHRANSSRLTIANEK